MDPRWRHPYGLRPTLRHQMILVVHCALLSALVAPLLRGGLYGVATLLLPLTPPLLTILILIFDRPGPAKYWLAGLVASLFLPSLVLWGDLVAIMALVGGSGQVAAVLLVLIILNGVGLWSLVRWTRRLPRRCPGCGLWSLLPLGTRASPLLWCTSCGFKERGRRPNLAG